MSKLIPDNQKPLSLHDRQYIDTSLNNNVSFKDIARYLCKDPTTISKEVRKYRLSEFCSGNGLFHNEKNHCIHRAQPATRPVRDSSGNIFRRLENGYLHFPYPVRHDTD